MKVNNVLLALATHWFICGACSSDVFATLSMHAPFSQQFETLCTVVAVS